MLAKASPTDDAEAVRTSIVDLCGLTVRRRRREVVDRRSGHGVRLRGKAGTHAAAGDGAQDEKARERRLRFGRPASRVRDRLHELHELRFAVHKTVGLADYFITDKHIENVDG